MCRRKGIYEELIQRHSQKYKIKALRETSIYSPIIYEGREVQLSPKNYSAFNKIKGAYFKTTILESAQWGYIEKAVEPDGRIEVIDNSICCPTDICLNLSQSDKDCPELEEVVGGKILHPDDIEVV